jgi:alpha-tubulin suppressor-like RCC1 family protein
MKIKLSVFIVVYIIIFIFVGCSPAVSPSASQTASPASSSLSATVSPTVKITGVFSGYYSSSFFMLRNDGSLWAFGANGLGQLGDGSLISKVIARPVFGTKESDAYDTSSLDSIAAVKVMDGVQDVSAGMDHTLILKQDGTLWGCGSNAYFQLGSTLEGNISTPVKIMDGVRQASAGVWHSLAVKQDGSLWTFGCNTRGQLGTGTPGGNSAQKKIMDGVRFAAAGAEYSLAIKEDGSLWAWGDNETAQLGDGTTEPALTPKKIMDNVIYAAASTNGETQKEREIKMHHPATYGYKIKGKKAVWGVIMEAFDSVVGKGTYYNFSGSTTYAIKSDGTLWGWGQNDCGQIAGCKDICAKSPVQIAEDVSALSAGAGYAFVLKQDGTLWTCGNTGISEGSAFVHEGVLYRIYHCTAAPSGLQKAMDDVLSIACGKSEALIVKKDGSVCCKYHENALHGFQSVKKPWDSGLEPKTLQ